MKMNRHSLLPFWTGCLALLLLLAPSVASGADTKPPEKMAFQGFLTDANGAARGQAAPVNLEITFRLYKSPTADASAAVWSEKQTVTVDKGHFSVVLGDGVLVSGTADFANHFSGMDTDAGRYLGVQVTGETEIAPRIQFFTAPYASLARYATELVGTAGTSVLKVSNDRAGINLVGAPSTTLDVGGIVTATGLDVNGTSTLDGTTTVAGSLRVTGNNVLELGSGVVGKEGSAGKIGYGTFTTGSLDIVGAGTAGNNRAVKIWAEGGTTFTGPVSASSFTGTHFGDGSGITGVAKLGGNTFSGTQTITAGGLQFDNGQVLQARNAAGNYENFLWPRWSDNVMYMNYGSGGLNIRNNASGTALFLENNGRATFSSGILAKGSLTVDAFNNTTTFQVTGDVIQVFNGDNKAKYFQMFRYGGGVAMQGFGGGWGNASGDFRQITWDGDGNWDAASDRKLKKDIVDAEPVLERALQVQVRRFRWKDDAADAKLALGVIAQELQPLFPDLVAVQEMPGTKETNLAVGYSDFGLIAVKAIQELKKQQDAEIADLKTQVADLKSQMKQVLQAAAELRGQVEKSKVTASVGQ